MNSFLGNQQPVEDESKLFRVLPWLALTLLLGLLLVFVSLFQYKFHEPGVWGQLGDFVGGTLNPLLAFLSLLVLLETMREQRRQLRQSRQHSVLEELQRLMSSVSVAIDELLARPVPATSRMLNLGRSEWVKQREAEARFKAYVAGHTRESVVSLRSAIDGVATYLLWDYSEEAFSAISLELREIREQLKRLDWCLGEFLANGGARVIANFYGVQYRQVALVTAALGTSYDGYTAAAVERIGLGKEFSDLLDSMSTVRMKLEAARITDPDSRA